MNDNPLKDIEKYIPELSLPVVFGICIACAIGVAIYRAYNDEEGVNTQTNAEDDKRTQRQLDIQNRKEKLLEQIVG